MSKAYTREQIIQVISLKDKGFKHRDIAQLVFGRESKSSTVHYILNKYHANYIGLQPEPAANFVQVGNSGKPLPTFTTRSSTNAADTLARYTVTDAVAPVCSDYTADVIPNRVHKSPPQDSPIRIMFIPDAQVKKGVEINHLNAIGNYIVDKKPDVIVNIGDFADMPSLSQYERIGSKATEGARYRDDIDSTHIAMDALLQPLKDYNEWAIVNDEPEYHPRMIMTLGNHEHRITRAINDNPRHFEGVISLDDLGYEEAGWEVYPFLEMVEVGGVYFSHYFVNPTSLTKNTIGGMMETKLKNLGFSFAMGHQQILQHGILYRTTGDSVQGLVAGSFYQHNEGYMNIQGNRSHWRGAVMLNEVQNGNYDIMPLSMNYLLRKWDF